MKSVKTASLFKLLGLVGAISMLGACATEPAATSWEKSSSPWDQRRSTETSTPAAETYKADLEMPAQAAGETTSEVELSYQTEAVDSFVPPAETEEPAELAVEAGDLSDEVTSIMDQPADYYTLQLMASVDIDRVIRFANENQISTKYIVATDRNGVVWHVLLLDVYVDYSAAVAARDEIAPSLKNAPWIRKVGSVQKLVH